MNWAIVMAGGQGTRLWPISRSENPKQFLRLVGRKTLIENTIERVSKVIPPKRIFIITDSANLSRTRRLFQRIPADQIIGEPAPRNTAATIGLGAFLIQKKDPHAVAAVFPSDHVILNLRGFKRSVERAIGWAQKGAHPVVFGVKPTYPATAYGYVEVNPSAVSKGVYALRRFIEKPNAAKARKLFRASGCYWQAGIFVWRVDAILDSFRRHLPAHFGSLSRIAEGWKGGQTSFSLPHEFKKIPSISIDYGIMEKLKRIFMVPANFDWNDVGSWNALKTVWSNDLHGNASYVPLISLDAKHNLAYSENRLICFLGVNDLIVVDSHDAILVASQDCAERVKDLVELLRKKKLARHL